MFYTLLQILIIYDMNNPHCVRVRVMCVCVCVVYTHTLSLSLALSYMHTRMCTQINR
jgi:hypothetical protein